MDKQKSLLLLRAVETHLTFTPAGQHVGPRRETLCTRPSPACPRLSHAPAQTKPPHPKHSRKTCTWRATQLLHSTSKICVFLRERAPLFQGWGEDHSRSQSKPQATQFHFFNVTWDFIPLARGFPSPLQALPRNTSAPRPEANASIPYPRTTGKASLLSSAVTDMPK